MFFPSGSTILKDNSPSKPTQNGSKRLSERYFLLLVFCLRFGSLLGSILVPFWLPKLRQVGSNKFKKSHQARSKTDIIPKTVQDASQGRPGRVSGWPGGGSWAAPRGILEAFWEQKLVPTANQRLGQQKTAKRSKSAEWAPRGRD